MTAKGKLKTILIFAVIAALLFAAFAGSYRTVMKLSYPHKYEEFVEKYSAEFGLDSALLYAVIRTESSFDPSAVSSADAVGLTQITPETFEWLRMKLGETQGELSLLDPETSVKYGAFFLSYLLDEFGETPVALAAYHAGRGRVNSWLKDPEISPDGKILTKIPISETAHYVKKVTKALNIYSNLYK